MADVFISYHTKSAAGTAKQIADTLEAAGFSCWYAPRDVKGVFARDIIAAIDECKIFLLVLNEQANESEHVLNEVNSAFYRVQNHEEVHIVPFRMGDFRLCPDLRYYLGRLDIVNGGTASAPRISALVGRIGKLLGREAVHPKPAQPPEPAQPPKPAPEQTPAQVQLPHGLRPITLEEFVTATAPKREKKPEPVRMPETERKFPQIHKPAQTHSPLSTPTIVLPAHVLPPQPRIISPKCRIYCNTIFASWDFTVGIQTNGTVIGTGNSNRYGDSKRWRDIVSLTEGNGFLAGLIGLTSNGRVLAMDRSDIDGFYALSHYFSGWSNIVAIATGNNHIIGLKSDGTVLAGGRNKNGQCNVSGWSGVVAVAAGGWHTVGLKADGMVLATGLNFEGQCNVSDWSNVVAVAAGLEHTVGLKSDGTVLATGQKRSGRCKVSGWSDVVSIKAGPEHTLGLKSDGSILATGQYRDVSDWSRVVAIEEGKNHTVGLKSDGTVLATGNNNFGQCNVSGWFGVVEIAAGGFHTVGLKSDGTVLATGDNDSGQCNVQDWRLRLPEWVEI